MKADRPMEHKQLEQCLGLLCRPGPVGHCKPVSQHFKPAKHGDAQRWRRWWRHRLERSRGNLTDTTITTPEKPLQRPAGP
jgi:hypothetical protein